MGVVVGGKVKLWRAQEVFEEITKLLVESGADVKGREGYSELVANNERIRKFSYISVIHMGVAIYKSTTRQNKNNKITIMPNLSGPLKYWTATWNNIKMLMNYER